jgi:hypothetical protein
LTQIVKTIRNEENYNRTFGGAIWQNGECGSLSGCGINLCCTELGDWLEIEMNGVLDLGEVNYKIE